MELCKIYRSKIIIVLELWNVLVEREFMDYLLILFFYFIIGEIEVA